MKRKHIFSLSFLIILIIIYGIERYMTRAYMTLLIRFKGVPPVIQGLMRGGVDAYYRGYLVGTVRKIALSNDQKYIVFYVAIKCKNLRLPKNTVAVLESEDLYGKRHLILGYPKNPSSQLLVDGDMLDGADAPDRIDDYLVNELESGRLNELLENALILTRDLKRPVQDINQLSSRGLIKSMAVQLPQTLNNTVKGINTVNRNIPIVNTAVNNANKNIIMAGNIVHDATNNINTASNDITDATKNISQINQAIPETTKTILHTDSLLSSTDANLSMVNSKIPQIPPNLLENANQELLKLDCMTNVIAQAVSKRFLLFRFMFGNPASEIKNCIPQNNNSVPNSK